jgi:hypothetical protein
MRNASTAYASFASTDVVAYEDLPDHHLLAVQNSGTSTSRNLGPSAPPTSPTEGTNINAQLAQARELEAKLTEEYRTV